MNWSVIIKDFITIFAVVDPIGSIPIFLFATASIPAALHTRFAIRAVVISALVLFGFLVGGQLILEALGVRLGAFQVAGGIILFLFAMTMIFGESKPEAEQHEAERDHLSGAVFPLAIPSIASPGAMLGVVVLTDNQRFSFSEQLVTAVLLALVLLVTLALLILAKQIHRIIGATGANVISRVMGIILATIAIDSVFNGMDVLGIITLNS
ncbi:MarC family protein [Halocynthiibacter sp. C4]|uniref:MarC family protein n=1 Tax=Halocynthiibacter sp. C4 TaxID=2992758 RepID=UPI00237A0D06|nr:MarC family protein [Halocynthiibacter sp. C4]MDE0589904.1 MarC family protein [Halocynthiibacter sp. C4]